MLHDLGACIIVDKQTTTTTSRQAVTLAVSESGSKAANKLLKCFVGFLHIYVYKIKELHLLMLNI